VRVRYEVRCKGRLLKVFPQWEVSTMGDLARREHHFVDGMEWWVVDEQRVEPDVARAMLFEYGEEA
jgi:hypothetical protein